MIRTYFTIQKPQATFFLGYKVSIDKNCVECLITKRGLFKIFHNAIQDNTIRDFKQGIYIILSQLLNNHTIILPKFRVGPLGFNLAKIFLSTFRITNALVWGRGEFFPLTVWSFKLNISQTKSIDLCGWMKIATWCAKNINIIDHPSPFLLLFSRHFFIVLSMISGLNFNEFPLTHNLQFLN